MLYINSNKQIEKGHLYCSIMKGCYICVDVIFHSYFTEKLQKYKYNALLLRSSYTGENPSTHKLTCVHVTMVTKKSLNKYRKCIPAEVTFLSHNQQLNLKAI